MAARSTWKGSLKLSLISIPIRVVPATTPAADVTFHQFHRKCHTRLRMKRWCPHCDEEVGAGDIIRGHETAKGRFVMVEEEDIAAVRPESTRTVEISHVMNTETIDPIYVERTYFLTPDNKAAGSPFAVLREALEGKAAIGRLALHGREYLVAVLPRDRALVLYTLRTAGEVRALTDLEGLPFAAAKTSAAEVKLARQVLQSFDTVADLTSFTDHYQEALRAMLRKRGTEEVVASEAGGKSKAPVNLIEALRKSLAAVEATKRRPARIGKRGSGRVLHYPAQRKNRKAG